MVNVTQALDCPGQWDPIMTLHDGTEYILGGTLQPTTLAAPICGPHVRKCSIYRAPRNMPGLVNTKNSKIVLPLPLGSCTVNRGESYNNVVSTMKLEITTEIMGAYKRET